MFLHADSEDWADAQIDLSLRWAHRPYCWFCHEAAHLTLRRHINVFTNPSSGRDILSSPLAEEDIVLQMVN